MPAFTPLARSLLSLMCSMLILCLLVAIATADTGAATAEDDMMLRVFTAITEGRWGWLAGLALIFAIEPAKRLLSGVSFIKTDIGGLALAFVMAAVIGVAHALLSGAAWTPDLPLAIARNALVAIGGYKAIKLAIVNQVPALKGAIKPLPTPQEVKSGTVET